MEEKKLEEKISLFYDYIRLKKTRFFFFICGFFISNSILFKYSLIYCIYKIKQIQEEIDEMKKKIIHEETKK